MMPNINISTEDDRRHRLGIMSADQLLQLVAPADLSMKERRIASAHCRGAISIYTAERAARELDEDTTYFPEPNPALDYYEERLTGEASTEFYTTCALVEALDAMEKRTLTATHSRRVQTAPELRDEAMTDLSSDSTPLVITSHAPGNEQRGH
jgi:hypothetical protein